MRIGIDASRAQVERRTGTERYALEITRALVAAAPEEEFVLYLRQRPDPGLLPHPPRVRWRVIPTPRLWTALGLTVEMLRRPPDVLFVPAHSLPLAQPRATVATIHDLGYLRFPGEHDRAARILRDVANRWSAARARRLIAVSAATRDDLVACYDVDPARITVVYHGRGRSFQPIEPAAARREVAARFGLDGPYFLFVGTLQPRKNVERLLAAFDRFVQRTGRPHALAMAGAPGWQQRRLGRALGAMRARDRVRLLGYVSDGHLPALMSGATALALPSLYEGFGLPALEAMACGTPVVASSTSSLPEVVGDAGLLVDPLDVDAIADALATLAGDDVLGAELGRRGLARAAEFTWERAARATLAVLRQASLDP